MHADKRQKRLSPPRKKRLQRGTEPGFSPTGVVFFYSNINQHGLNTPLTKKTQRFWLRSERFSPNFPLFLSSTYFLSSSAPFRIFQPFTVGTNWLPCCLPAPVISTTCFYRASAVFAVNATNMSTSTPQTCAAIKAFKVLALWSSVCYNRPAAVIAHQ